MKKIISLILILCMAISALSAQFVSEATTHGYLLCDANDDGDIDSKDVLLIRKYMAGLVGDKDIDRLAADAVADDSIDSKDLLFVRKLMAGITEAEENNDDGLYKVDTVTVGGKNISRYVISVPNDADPCMKYSAGRLSKYIKNACGIALNIAEEKDVGDEYVIRYRYDEEDRFMLGKEGYRITVGDDGNVEVVCGSMRGPLYATYYILENFIGYRFLLNDVEYLYKAENADIPTGFEETEVPALEYRAVAQAGCTEKNYEMLHANAMDSSGSGACQNPEHGWGLGTLYIHAHSYAYQMAGYEHIYQEEYSSKYYGSQPCLTDNATYEKIVDYCLNLIAERESWGQHLGKAYTQISCSPNDNTNFCMCVKCKQVYDEEGCVSGAVIRMSNKVAERLNEDYPGIEVFTISYSDNKNAPKLTYPKDNVCICICNGSCGNHPYDHTELCEAAGGNPRLVYYDRNKKPLVTSNVSDVEGFEEWMEISNNVYCWYYGSNFCFDSVSSPNIFNVYNDIKFYCEHGIKGIYAEGVDGKYYDLDYLRGYLISKMMWDPYMSEEEFNDLIDEYLMIYYGEGWRSIKEYIVMANEASDLMGCWTNNFDTPWNMYSKDYFAKNYSKMSALFDNAYAEAKENAQKERISALRVQCDFLGLSATYKTEWVGGNASEKAAYLKKYREFYELVTENNIMLSHVVQGKCGCENLPESSDVVTDPMGWIIESYAE